MQHYTLNTGHTRTSARSEVRDDVLDKLRPWTRPGEYQLADLADGLAGYRLVVPDTGGAALVATLYRGKVPLLTLGVAATPEDEAVVWPPLESLYLKITESPLMRSADFAAPDRPASLPWLAVVLVAPHLVPEWVGDLERCLAWAYLGRAD